jgi:hypothetical protein
MGELTGELLTTLGPAAIAAYLLIDRVFKFVNTRNGKDPNKNLEKIVNQNLEMLKHIEHMVAEFHALRLDIAKARCPYVEHTQIEGTKK